MKLFFLDVETTGTDPKQHGLIQVSGILEIPKHPEIVIDLKIQPFPTDQIQDEALTLNHTTREELASFLPPREAYLKLTGIIQEHVDKFDRSDKLVVIGYNSGFDTEFLRCFFAKNGDAYYGSLFWFPDIDVMRLAMFLLRAERSTLLNFKLATVASRFGIKVDEGALHDSLYDVRLTRDLYRIIEGRLK